LPLMPFLTQPRTKPSAQRFKNQWSSETVPRRFGTLTCLIDGKPRHLHAILLVSVLGYITYHRSAQPARQALPCTRWSRGHPWLKWLKTKSGTSVRNNVKAYA
jgi:hypothetical protein